AVHHADDDRLDRDLVVVQGHARRAALAHDQHRLSGAGVHGVHGDEVGAVGLAIQAERLDHQQLVAGEMRVLVRGHHLADHPADHHGAPSSGRTWSTKPMIDASTATILSRSGSVASRAVTKYTSSPGPEPIVSTATSGLPRTRP